MFSVIVPTYNRLDNLKRCLYALQNQKNAPKFEIIVIDDGSTDGTFEWLRNEYIKRNDCLAKVRYLSGGPNKGFRGGRARNIAAFNTNLNSDRLIFVDSDVLLNEYALQHYQIAANSQSSAIIVGQYHWLPPVVWNNDLVIAATKADYDELIQLLAPHIDRTVHNDSPFGYDVRRNDFVENVNETRTGSGLGALSGNISYSKDFFTQLGGFDERIVGHGGEDADLGLTADQQDVKWLFYKPIYGYHMWHARDQAKNAREVQANITYIDWKHGIGKYDKAKKWTDAKDWTEPVHYHKHLGGRLCKVGYEPTVYAVNENHYVALPSQTWITELGFIWDDVEVVEKEYFNNFTYEKALPPLAINSNALVNDKYINPKEFSKQAGGRIWRIHGSSTVFASVNGYKMGLPSPDWITRLGYTTEDILIYLPNSLEAEGYKDAGIAVESNLR